MPKEYLLSIAWFFKRFFFLFLDISGIMLGVFLGVLGWWILSGKAVPRSVGGIVLFLGLAAFVIHVGHYFHLKIVRRIFGPDYFLMPPGAGKDERRNYK